jgi:uncharacterized protein (TIGR02001 family)
VFSYVNVNRGEIHMIGYRAILGVSRLALVGATVFAVAPALAEDAESKFDIAFGVAAVSDYISRGISQTEHGGAIQGYVEPSVGALYAGVWASNVKFDPDTDTEIDFYAGIRPEVGPISFDFGYNYATYRNDPESNGGEFYAKADVAADDNVTIGGQFYINPANSATYVEANADITLPHNFGVSGAVGAINGDVPYTTWNAGIYYMPVDWAKVDVRYSATSLDTGSCTGNLGNECDARVVVGLSIDTSLSALKAK